MQKSDIAIIGGGPAGLSLARFLKDGGINAVVFEKQPRIGGKSFSFEYDNRLIELGTCYTTLNHKQTKRWMKALGVTLDHLGTALFDGKSPMAYAKKGDGPPISVQSLSYYTKANRLKKRLKAGAPDALEEASLSTEEWLLKHGLHKIALAMHRLQTVQGYGYIQDTSIAQTLQWCDIPYVMTGLLNAIHMPREGWSEFWARLAADLDVRVSSEVTEIERQDDGVVLTVNGQSHAFRYIASTIPIDDFGRMTELSSLEADIADATFWRQYTTSLISSPDWFQDVRVNAYSSAMLDKSHMGELFGGRLEGDAPDLGGKLYVTGQYHEGMSHTELAELLHHAASERGFTISSLIKQQTYKYGPIFRRDAVRGGLLQKLEAVQGQNRTWHGGAGFSHELISSVVKHSKGLSAQLSQALKA